MNLYAHQKNIIEADPEKTGLFLGTGSGKTRVALSLARGSTLVIAPKTQVDDQNWQRECCNMLFGTYHPSLVGDLPEDFNVITFDKFKAQHETLDAFDTVIVDEAHGMLGVTAATCWRKRVQIPKASQRFEALQEYLERTKPQRIYLCTATIIKSPMTVWAAYRILRPYHASTEPMHGFLSFRYIFYTQLPMPGRQVFAPKSDSATKHKLARLVKEIGYTGRLEDYFDVPEQTFRTEHMDLTDEQKKRIKTLELEYPDPFIRVGKRHQVENGCLAGDEFKKPESFKNAKVERIVELASEFPRMVVFAKYTEQIMQIQKALTEAGFATWTLTGATKDRQAVIRQANELDGVLIAQAQISAGWEVPLTPVMVFASRTYSFVDYDQALGRIQRANNIKKNLYISLVVRKGVDEAVDRALANKQDFNEKLYGEVEA